ncbi:hypothetical protein O999_09725 [Pseudomonas putida LF54]|jgi:hypothetical protein|nr:hypothetical protein O999_09725 [Pseudomonas putida LF54]
MTGEIEMARFYDVYEDEDVLLEIASLEARLRYQLLRK